MQAKHRTTIGFVVLIGLWAAIAMALRSHESRIPVDLTVSAMLVVLTGAALAYGAWIMFGAHVTDVSLLTGALWDLVRMMELRSRSAAAGRNDERRKLLQEFAVEGAHKVGAGRPMPMGDTAALDLTRLAFELMDRNDKEGASISNRVHSLRRGLFVFYAIVELRRPEIAFRAMCEHMKIQLRQGPESGIDNFTELKQLLGLPLAWPADANGLELLERRGLTISRQLSIDDAARRGREEIFRGVHYVPPGQTHGFSTPGEILQKMRDYIR